MTGPGDALETVTSAEFVRRFGAWQDRIAIDPIVVTHHGRRRVVMLSVQRYEELASAGADLTIAGGEKGLRLAVLVDRLDAGLVAIDTVERVIEANPAACAHLGLGRAALVGRLLGELPDDLARSIAAGHLAYAVTRGEVAQFDFPSLDRPGSWLRAQTFPFGQGAAILFRNVDNEAEGLRLAGRLAAHEAALAVHGEIGHGRLSVRGTFAAVDPVLAGFAGVEPANLAQVRLVDVLPPALRAAAVTEIEAVLSTGGARAFDTRLLVRQGGERAVRIGLAVLRGDYAIDGASIVMTPAFASV